MKKRNFRGFLGLGRSFLRKIQGDFAARFGIRIVRDLYPDTDPY
jgi:hypothetical protein